ncbi:hypothetical protein ACIRD9_42550 [Streptomyces violaceus]|uniref:hypothetical protein n=1 Tax=Streptomyces violaceus TaxID=1936 RepID=UPI00381C08FA
MDGIRRTVRPSAAPANSRLGALTPEASVSMTSGRGAAATKSWTPTVANLLVLVVVEVVAFAALRMVINKIV